MSDSYLPGTPYVPGSAPAEDPAGVAPPPPPGTPEVDANVGDFQEEAPAREYFELDDDTAGRYVTVKIDGVDTEVTLGEALKGYQRQADYTRKTQDLAAKAKEAEFGIAFQRAMQANPELAIQAVAQKYGITLGQARQVAEQQQRMQPQYDPDPYDPYGEPSTEGYAPRIGESQSQYEQRLARIEQMLDQQRADAILGKAVDGLRTSGADEQDIRSVINQAMQLRLGPDAFPMIYGNMKFAQMQQAQVEAQAVRQQENVQRQQAAVQAGAVTGQGPSAAGAGSPPPPETEFNDIHSAFEAAWKQHVG